MILVDTSVWIDHWRLPQPHLAELLRNEEAFTHPMVVGELACGYIGRREGTMRILNRMPQAPVATYSGVLYFIERHRLMGRGIGYIDVHLLASASLDSSTQLWTVDRRLRDAAAEVGLADDPRI